MTIQNVILGAGISGIAAAYDAQRRGQNVAIYEAGGRPGGLLDNFVHDGFRFDTGVHLSFAAEPEVRKIFDQTPYHEHAAESSCWDNGFWCKHPIQNNLFALPPADKVELIAGLIEQPPGDVANYEDWLVQQYGRPIAARWPIAYTEKYWTVPAARMGTGWIGKRMRKADVREVLRGAFTADTPNDYYVSHMRYPKQGGYRAFLDPMLKAIAVTCDHKAVGIDAAARRVRFSNGTTVDYERLISTIPLPDLIEMTENVPPHIRELASTLFATQLDLISVGFRRPNVAPSLWFYIYDADILASRAYAPDRKSPANVPAGCSALQFEIYSSRHRPQKASVEEMKKNTVMALQKMKLATPEDIILLHHKHVPFANVVFDLGMEERRNEVRAWVAAQGITLAGRFGAWDYLWSNQAMMSGLQASRQAFA